MSGSLKSDMRAYVWDEVEPLRVYRAKVECFVDTFDKDVGGDATSKKSLYYTRFVNGLPEDYADYIMLSMPTKCTDINKALEACLRFQNIKKRKSGKPEVGASASFKDPAVSSRIAQNEAQILKLEKEMKKMAKEVYLDDSSASTESQ